MPEDGLAGRRILVLRPEGQAGALAEALDARGATPVVVPAVRILPPVDWAPVDGALTGGDRFDWLVFTSANGAEAVAGRLSAIGADGGATGACRIAAIGPATRRALRAAGIPVHWMPGRYTTRALAAGLPALPGEGPTRVCLLRADIAGPELEDELRARGFVVERVDAYRTEIAGRDAVKAALEEGVDAVALTSASIARALVDAAGPPPLPGGPRVCCIGPATAEACRDLGLAVACEAAEHTVPGLVAAMSALFGAA